MEQKHIVFDSELCDAAVDRTSNGFASPPKIEKDASRISPGRRSAFEVSLNFEVLAKKIPFAFIECALQQFKLMEPRENGVFAVKSCLESRTPPAGAIAQHVDPDGGVDENHPRSFRIAL
jgi:hypothetical protein